MVRRRSLVTRFLFFYIFFTDTVTLKATLSLGVCVCVPPNHRPHHLYIQTPGEGRPGNEGGIKGAVLNFFFFLKPFFLFSCAENRKFYTPP